MMALLSEGKISTACIGQSLPYTATVRNIYHFMFKIFGTKDFEVLAVIFFTSPAVNSHLPERNFI